MPDDDQQHPVLSEDEDRAQRGEAPPGSFGHTDPRSGDLAPGWQPNDDNRNAAEEQIKTIGRGEHRPHREDVYPYLLIRAYSPGDRGARPTWPPIPCWESPDILLIDAAHTGPFDPSRIVVNPTAGRSYRVFVRVWNLGLLPAVGVHVRAWHVDPGFFGGNPGNPAYQPVMIGGTMVNLDDRTRPGAMQVVELDRNWDIPGNLTGHECLMATASCPLDQWGSALDANHDRHVGQRNLTILAGDADAKQLLFTLGGLVQKSGTLELLHGGAAAAPLLQAVLGPEQGKGLLARLREQRPDRLRLGVPIGGGRHLLTMFGTERGWLVADSARVWKVAVELGVIRDRRRPGAGHPFATPLGSRRIIERIGVDRADAYGVLLDGDPGEALIEGLARLWLLGGLSGRDLATALADDPHSVHLLRLTYTDREREEAGGYSLTVTGLDLN